MKKSKSAIVWITGLLFLVVNGVALGWPRNYLLCIKRWSNSASSEVAAEFDDLMS
jgi:hypothetical protein